MYLLCIHDVCFTLIIFIFLKKLDKNEKPHTHPILI